MKQIKFSVALSIISLFLLASCKTKSECPAFDDYSNKKEEKDNTQYKLILLKDGKKVGINDKKSNKKPKQKLFKKKMQP
tara:strand:+ start:505 stop:741 length:237 start_codon:yes stop_codon:yes gene_type:complete